MTRARQKLSISTGALGVVVLALVLILDSIGWLSRLEFYGYDLRARVFQKQNPPPTTQLVHIDIDDPSLEEIGRWPWPRARMAEIIDELHRAAPKVVGLDIFFSEPEPPRPEAQIDDTWPMTDNDEILARSIRNCGNVLVPVHIPLGPTTRPDIVVQAISAELSRNLEQDDEQLVRVLSDRGFASPDLDAKVRREHTAALKDAMFSRIDVALGMGNAGDMPDVETLRKELLPISAATRVKTNADHVLDQMVPKVEAARSMERFMRPLDPDLPPLMEGSTGEATIPVLADAAEYCGFVDYPLFSDGVVRAVPLWIVNRQRMLPQAGFALACAYLGVDVRQVQVAPDRLTLPLPNGSTLVIPVHGVASDQRGEMGLFMDIPWVGSDNWQTIYDPAHQTARQHMPITKVWELCQLSRQVESNNYAAMTDITLVLLRNDVDVLAKIQAKKTPYTDAEQWNNNLDDAFAAVSDGTKKEYKEVIDPKKLPDFSPFPPADRNYIAALRALQTRSLLNNDLLAARAKRRTALADELGGKAVLIGWVASGRTDMFSTPLHVNCPGAAIHGTIFNGIVTGNLYATLPGWMTKLTTLTLGLLALLAALFLPPLRAVIAAGILVAGYLALNCLILFENHHLILGLAGPLSAVAGVSMACGLLKFKNAASDKVWITDQFRCHVDPKLVDYLIEHPAEAEFEGKDRELTVVFTDLANFTTLSEKLKADSVQVLNDYLGRMEPIIHANNGLVNKFLGDGIMFFFGAPKPFDPEYGHAEAAVRTVLQMQAAMLEFNKTLKERGLPSVKMRAGVSSGKMVVGNAGTKNRSDYTVLGDRVNLGSRLEGANKMTGTLILISDETVELMKGACLVRKIGRLQVVGRNQWVMTYEPLTMSPQATEEMRLKVQMSDTAVDAFINGDFSACITAMNELEKRFGDSELVLCDLYRKLCRQYIDNHPRFFDGSIKLPNK